MKQRSENAVRKYVPKIRSENIILNDVLKLSNENMIAIMEDEYMRFSVPIDKCWTPQKVRQ